MSAAVCSLFFVIVGQDLKHQVWLADFPSYVDGHRAIRHPSQAGVAESIGARHRGHLLVLRSTGAGELALAVGRIVKAKPEVTIRLLTEADFVVTRAWSVDTGLGPAPRSILQAQGPWWPVLLWPGDLLRLAEFVGVGEGLILNTLAVLTRETASEFKGDKRATEYLLQRLDDPSTITVESIAADVAYLRDAGMLPKNYPQADKLLYMAAWRTLQQFARNPEYGRATDRAAIMWDLALARLIPMEQTGGLRGFVIDNVSYHVGKDQFEATRRAMSNRVRELIPRAEFTLALVMSGLKMHAEPRPEPA